MKISSLLRSTFAGLLGLAAAGIAQAAISTTSLTSSPDPSVFGETVIFTATVSAVPPETATPTGTVTFIISDYDGGSSVIPLDGAGQAQLTLSDVSVGTSQVVAVYSGDSTFDSSSSPIDSHMVVQASTTTIVTATPDPSVAGELVEIVATVTVDPPGAGTPTGTVTFTGSGGLNQTVTLASGQAVLTTNSLASGTIVATYNSDSNFLGSVGTAAVTVNPADTTTIVTATPDPSVFGESVTVVATVTTDAPGSGTATGTVTFNGPGGLNQTVALDGTGQAGLTTTTLTTGTITATYNGDTGHNSSVGTVAVTVNPADTTTTVTATPNPSVFGESVTVVATVTTDAPGSGIATGTVTFNGSGGLNQTVALDGTGQAGLTTTTLTTGTITATYNGDTGHNSSVGTVAVTVNPADTTTTVTATPNPSVFGESVTVVATVTTDAPGSGIATGTVTFNGPGGLNQTVALDGTGQAALTTTTLTTGTITATYNGDTGHNSSVGTVAVTVNPADTTTTVTATPDPSVFGESVTVVATVTTDAPGSGTATGTVTFNGSGGLSQTVALDGTGQAALTTTTLTTGTITVTYNGDAGHSSSVGTAAVTVNPADTTTTVVVDPDSSVYGQSVEVSALITANAPGSGIPTGTVTFTGPDGLNQTVTVDVDGVAAFTTTTLKTGTVTATYNGDTAYNPSMGTATATVNHGSISVTLVATPSVLEYGNNVTLTATVAVVAPAAGTPSGTIKFMDGAVLLQSVALADGVATFVAPSLGGGSHVLTALYSGDTNFDAATSAPVTVIVDPASQTITFAPIGGLFIGQSVALSATATSGLPVSFSVLSGPATISGGTLTATGVGSVTVRASQSGDSNYAAAPDVERSFAVTIGEPTVTTPNEVPAPGIGGTAELSAGANNPNLSYQWQRNGADLAGASGSSLTLTDVQPPTAGLYTYTASVPGGGIATSEPVIVGISTTEKVVGTGTEVGADIVHPNGNTYDQVLLEGKGATITSNPSQITRISFVDLSNDIVQVEFSGAGTLSVVMDDASVPAPAANYHQPEVDYVKGHVGLVITGANETSHVSVISVGPITAVNQSLFKDDVTYDGVANIAFIAIQSSNGKFGGVRAGNVHFFANQGFTGVYAPGVEVAGPVNIGDVSAFDSATPVLVFGAADVVNITGGSLHQANGQPVKASGITQLKFVDGTTSQGVVLPAQANEAVVQEEGVDITDLIVVNP